MSLTRSQYDAVMRLYDKKQIEDHRIMEERKRKAYSAIPELSAIDGEVADQAVARLRRSLMGDDALPASAAHAAGTPGAPRASGAVSSDAMPPEEKKRVLLREHGFPEDYLDPVSSCPDCHDTGFIGREKCHCFRQAVVELFYTQSNLKKVLEEENFDHFSLDWYPEDLIDPDTGLSSRETMRRILDYCRKYASGFDSLEQNCLMLCGESGRGKTYLSHCIAKELMDSAHSVIYYSSKDLFDSLAELRFRPAKGSAAGGEPDASPFDPDYLISSDLLIIDDLGTEMPNDFTKSEFFGILNSRLGAGKGIIISTNLSFQDMSDIYSPRIMSRIMENFRLLSLFGRDIRIMKRMQPGR